MACRTSRERLYQTIGYEVGGLLVATPICVWLTGMNVGGSAMLLIVLSVSTLLWSPLFNDVFDRMEWRFAGRLASDRTKKMRLFHAFALEGSDMVISVPILMILGGLDFFAALIADLGLLAIYVAYTYVYHQLYDWLRPVRHCTGRGATAVQTDRSRAVHPNLFQAAPV